MSWPWKTLQEIPFTGKYWQWKRILLKNLSFPLPVHHQIIKLWMVAGRLGNVLLTDDWMLFKENSFPQHPCLCQVKNIAPIWKRIVGYWKDILWTILFQGAHLSSSLSIRKKDWKRELEFEGRLDDKEREGDTNLTARHLTNERYLPCCRLKPRFLLWNRFQIDVETWRLTLESISYFG